MKRKKRDTPGRRIAQAIIAQYKPKSVAEMQAALKEVFGPMLGYDNSVFKFLYLKVIESQKNGHLAQSPTGRSFVISYF